MTLNKLNFLIIYYVLFSYYEGNCQQNTESIAFNTVMKIKRDSIIWASVSAPFGIELFRIMFSNHGKSLKRKKIFNLATKCLKNLFCFFKLVKFQHTLQFVLFSVSEYVEWISNCCCDLLPKYLVRFTFQLNVVVYTYYI